MPQHRGPQDLGRPSEQSRGEVTGVSRNLEATSCRLSLEKGPQLPRGQHVREMWLVP